jgi:hypothetical protein
MVLAAKSVNENKLYLAISNYKSDYQNYNIHISNLPWQTTDQITITKNFVMGPGDKFTETETHQPGGNVINISVNDMPNPSITLLRIEKETGSKIEQKNSKLEDFSLNQNYPNPFNSSTAISYQLSTISHVELIIYDVNGKQVRTLINNNKSAGVHSVVWNGKDNLRNSVVSGVYFYQLKWDDGISRAKKLLLLK